MAPNSGDILTIGELSDYLKISKSTLYEVLNRWRTLEAWLYAA